ncbi:MAG: DUF1549 domain-containing protein, partial [Planctomycetes bacterium]|nr:DUF1549 domain-containing protein [Planctomycetota bacterium]
RLLLGLIVWLELWASPLNVWGADSDFAKSVAPILRQHCIRCHNDTDRKGGLSLSSSKQAKLGSESGPIFDSQRLDKSLLLESISGSSPQMPKNGPPLTDSQIAILRNWVVSGANWPDDISLSGTNNDESWWSLKPISRPEIPSRRDSSPSSIARSPIDLFIQRELVRQNLKSSLEADRRTLYRRLSYDLIGLPPDPYDVDRFIADPDPTAYERLVDELLASPRYGERWARHWLDIVHYGETHGYDKDKPRPNAWPYRDYVIRALNDDKPYDQFVLEQLAGDALWPNTVDGITATGFIAAGPWDFIGHAEVPESKIDGQIARNLDRDDMVTTAMNAFCSLTVQCARCHNHKFDPVTQTDYYRMQAVFAAVDRVDRTFDDEPEIGKRRSELMSQQTRLRRDEESLKSEVARLGGDE